MHRLWQRMALGRFLVLGRVGMDLNSDPPGSRIDAAQAFSAGIGGSAGNIAVGLARQGSDVALVSCVSDDPVGSFCLAELRRYGVGVQHIRAVGGERRTSLALTETVLEGCQTVIYRNNAADLALSEADVSDLDYGVAAALVVTGTALAAEPSRGATLRAMALARRSGALVVLDLDYRAYSWPSREEAARVCARAAQDSDLVIGNDVEFGLIAGDDTRGPETAETLVREGALVAIYKCGSEGSITFAEGERFETPIFPVAARKPTGAGDGFMAGFLSGLVRRESMDQSVRRGAAMAAMVVSGIGCAPAMPTRDELDAFLAQSARSTPANRV